jgi:hypothetical protein
MHVDGDPGLTHDLWEWLVDNSTLGKQVSAALDPGHVRSMASVTELTVALTSTGALASVLRAVGIWLTHRHSDLTVTFSLPDGGHISLDGKRVTTDGIERLILAMETPRDTQATMSDQRGPAHPG